MATDVNKNSKSSSGSGVDWNAKRNENGVAPDGEETEGEGEETEETTDENSECNDPEMNKKISEITIAEQIRQTYNLTIKLPKILKGLHTNQFFFMDVTNDFYETNYPIIIEMIANRKFARYSGFEKGRFFIEKVVEKGGVDGWSMEITLNPIPPSLAIWTKMYQEAMKLLMNKIRWEKGGTGTGDNSGLSNYDGDTITVTGKPTCGHCSGKSDYVDHTRTYVNKCPFCGGKLADNPKGVADGEVTCTSCDADFCSNCGYEKLATPRQHLTPVGKSFDGGDL